MMTTTTMTTMSLPASLSDALGHMQRLIACPEDVKARIAALRVPAQEVCGTRNAANWRQGASPQQGAPFKHHGGGGGGGGRSAAGGGWHRVEESRYRPPRNAAPSHHIPSSHHTSSHPSSHHTSSHRRPFSDRSTMVRFGNKGNKEASTESRMMDRIRSKMNMFTESTYASTKTWLSELLDSGETEFLDGFITLVFEKAATEKGLTSLYAKLLVELRMAFAHIDAELQRIFGDFQQIFVLAATEPDVGSEEYGAFIKARERRRYRRGYASFIGEIARRGALTTDDIMGTCGLILDGMYQAKATVDNCSLVEEYADCLSMIIKGTHVQMGRRLREILPKIKGAQDRTGSPSMSAKARFALMDITDEFGST